MTTITSRSLVLPWMFLCVSGLVVLSFVQTFSVQAELYERSKTTERISAPVFETEVSLVETEEVKVLKRKVKEVQALLLKTPSSQEEVSHRRTTYQQEEVYRHPETGREIPKEEFKNYLMKKIVETQMAILEAKLSSEKNVVSYRRTPYPQERGYRHPETGREVTEEELKQYLVKKIAETRIALQIAQLKQERSASPLKRKRIAMVDQSAYATTLTHQQRDAMLLDIRQRIAAVQRDLALLLEKEAAEKSMKAPIAVAPSENTRRGIQITEMKDKEEKKEMKEKKNVSRDEEKPIVTLRSDELVVEKSEGIGKHSSSLIVSLIVFALLLLVFGVPFLMRWREKQKEEDAQGDNPWNNKS